ncbi:MAG: NADH:flavin oxidoreductase [Bacillota bacterium]
MKEKNKFKFKSLKELEKKIEKMDLDIPISKNLDILKNEIKLGNRIIPNSLAVHPMEGTDANKDGSPGELTIRRYRRFASGGAGLIWLEAVAASEDGRANDKQLLIKEDNLESFKSLAAMMRDEAKIKYGDEFNPYLVVQLNHSGRYGNNNNILFHHELSDQSAGISPDQKVMTDAELEQVEDSFLEASKLIKKAGFDAVDIKACHRYLFSEALAAHTREGKYGGSYENRTRLLKNTIKKVKNNVEIDIVVRLNVYDDIAYPYGWGTDDSGNMDLSEPTRLIRELENLGVKIINITASTPYLKPYINRPYDNSSGLGMETDEAPIVGVERLIKLTKFVSETVDKCLVIGTGFSWLREYAVYAAAGVVEKSWADMIGFGRLALAYPDFAQAVIENNSLDKKKVCVSCSKCAYLKAHNKASGCVVRDSKVYVPFLKEITTK